MAAPVSDFFHQRGILTHKAPSRVLVKARRIIVRLECGTPYWQMQGKRLQWNWNLISIPVGRSWRILAEDQSGRVHARQLLSHARYNHTLRIF